MTPFSQHQAFVADSVQFRANSTLPIRSMGRWNSPLICLERGPLLIALSAWGNFIALIYTGTIQRCRNDHSQHAAPFRSVRLTGSDISNSHCGIPRTLNQITLGPLSTAY